VSRRAIFNLVRVETISSSESANYSSGGGVQIADHDEVVLLDGFGDPCANPQIVGEEDRGIIHDYADGSEGRTPVVVNKTVAVAVDFLGNETYQKLVRWKAEDAEVHFNPGFGRRTEFAWRPVSGTTTIPDLTGKYNLTIEGNARDNTWDPHTGLRLMRDGFSGSQRILRTPGGAGQLFEGATENLFAIDDPQSGGSGWTAGGVGVATITLTHVADGFGATDCPHSVRVTGTATTDERSLGSAVMPSSVVGQGTLNGGVFVKGRFPSGAAIGCYNAPGAFYLNGEYGDWTWIPFQFIDTFVSSEPYIYIYLTTAATAETFDFQLAARTAVFRASVSQYAASNPQWQASGAARTADSLTTTAAMSWPGNGSLMVSFFAPEDFDDTLDSQWIGLCNPASGASCELSLIAYNGNTRLRAVFYFDAGGSKYVVGYADNGLIVPGAINTMCSTWNGKDVYLYLNGVLISSSTVAANASRSFGAVALKLGGMASGPFLLNAVRLEREPWNADRVLQEHVTATDPRALGVTVGCRGRRFKIVSLPQSQRVTAGASYWSGNIVLKQIGYTSALADIVSQEV